MVIFIDQIAAGLQLYGAKVFCLAEGQGMADLVKLVRINEQVVKGAKVFVVITGFQEIQDQHPCWVSAIRRAVIRLVELFTQKLWILGAPIPGSTASAGQLRQLESMAEFISATVKLYNNTAFCKAGKLVFKNYEIITELFQGNGLSIQGFKLLKQNLKDKIQATKWLK